MTVRRARLAIPVLVMLVAQPVRAQCPDGTPPPCERSTRRLTSVAVLSFENLSSDTTGTYLVDGLADDIATRLGQLQRLTVASRAAVRRLRNASATPVSDIGRTLNVAHLLTGSVRAEGGRLRVSVELLRAGTGMQVWAEQYDRADTNLLSIGEDIATAVASAIAGRLLPSDRGSLSASPTHNPEAYDAYLRALAALRGSGTPETDRRAVALLERALALDSTFAEAFAGLARAHLQAYWFGIDRNPERVVRARAAADRAVRLAPNRPQGHVALGTYYYWGMRDYARALEELRIADRLQPNNPDVHVFRANIERRQGRWEQALARYERAAILDPWNGDLSFEVAATLIYMRRFTEAHRYLDRTIALDPSYIDAWLAKAWVTLAETGDTTASAAVTREAANRVQLTWATANVQMNLATLLLYLDPVVQHAVDRLPGSGNHLLRAERLYGAGSNPVATAYADSARVALEARMGRQPDDYSIHRALGRAYLVLGRTTDAVQEEHRAVALLPIASDAVAGMFNELFLAIALTTVDEEAAITKLEGLLSIPSMVNRVWLRLDPRFTPLHRNPRFQRLVATGN